MEMKFTMEESGMEDMAHTIHALHQRFYDMEELGERISAVMYTSNMQGSRKGIDKYDRPYDKLSPNTIKRGRRGDGPPLAPVGLASSIILRFRTEISQKGPHDVTVKGHWPTLPWVHFHVTGTVHMPQRDPTGLRQFAYTLLNRAFHAWLDELFERRAPLAPETLEDY